MHPFFKGTRLALLSLLAVTVATSCVAPAEYRRVVDQYDADILALREERSALQRENQGLTTQIASLSSELGSANDENVRLLDAAATRPAVQPGLGSGGVDSSNFDELRDLGIGIESRNGGMVLTLPSSITFGSGQATLSKEGVRAVDAVGKTLLREYPGAYYSIEGHTDSDPISKSKFESNRALSLSRAMAVLRQLVDGGASVPDDHCSVVGWGPHRPLAANDSKANKARNRRVEIVVHRR